MRKLGIPTVIDRIIQQAIERIKVYARGWLNYYGIASMKNNIEEINGWLCHRIRMCIWKQWKLPRTKYRNLVKLGIPEHYAATIANYDLATAYQSVHINY